MIIKRINTDPFGNLSDASFEFEDGKTNVLLGETGSGKTTVFDALYSALFIDSKVRRNNPEYKKYIKKRYPLDGGNVVEVSIVFEQEGNEYELTKKWCKDKDKSEAILEGDDISRLEGDNRVNEKLKQILPSNKGTFKNVLMAYQAAIQEVFSIEDDEVYSELDEILRKKLETEGISPQEFLKRLEEESRDYGRRWDFKRGVPERKSNGGLYKQNIGKIYETYKEKKNKKEKLEEVRSKEEKIGEKNKELNRCSEELEEIEEFLETHKKAYGDSSERKELELKLENKKENHERLEKDFDTWEEAKETISTKKGESNILQNNLEGKKKEKEELEKFVEIQDLSQELQQEKEKLQAGKLDGSLKAKEDIQINIQKDMGFEIDEHSFKKGDKKQVEADGRLKIVSDPLDIEIQSGEGRFEERLDKIESLKEEKERTAEKYDIEIPLRREDPKEKLEDIKDEITDLKNDISDAERDIKDARDTVQEIKEKHEVSSLSEIGDKKSDVKKDMEELNEDLDQLEDVPESFSDASEFKEKYEGYRDKKDDLMKKKTDILDEFKDIDRPDVSSEELKEEVNKKENEFQRTLKKGKAYRFLKEKTEELLEEGELIYEQLKESFKEYFGRIYGKGFKGVNMDEMEIEGISHPEGYEIPRIYLSKGEGDIAALSIRLAMADYHLEDADGFLVMDDPLVNMDGPKRENAAELIDDLSEDKQIIMMTCDPDNAELFPEANIEEL
ncbi:MAG: AAA family ATPase [Candidatus Natronoplasma sp.]